MPVFTFSSKTKKPEDTKAVEEAKEYCDKHSLNFSAVMITLVKEFNNGCKPEV